MRLRAVAWRGSGQRRFVDWLLPVSLWHVIRFLLAAMLTGESTPKLKESLSDLLPNDSGVDRRLDMVVSVFDCRS